MNGAAESFVAYIAQKNKVMLCQRDLNFHCQSILESGDIYKKKNIKLSA